MIQKILLFTSICCVFLTACHEKKLLKSSVKIDSSVETTKTNQEIKHVIIDSNFIIDGHITGVNIDSVRVLGDILSIFVNYSGGCKTHSFDLLSNGFYAKSLPPQTSVYLKHESNGDACRQLIKEELKFNIVQLKYKGQNTVIINLGDQNPILYKTN